MCFFYLFLSSPTFFSASPPCLSSPLQPPPKVPMLQGDLVFFYYSCRLDLYMSLLGSSLLSRFSGIVICERFFYFMFYLFFVCVFVLIFELRQGFSVALDPVFGTSLRLASKLSQRSTSLFQIWNPSL